MNETKTFKQTKNKHASVYSHFRGLLTLAPISERLEVEMTLQIVLTIKGLSQTGIDPDFAHARQSLMFYHWATAGVNVTCSKLFFKRVFRKQMFTNFFELILAADLPMFLPKCVVSSEKYMTKPSLETAWYSTNLRHFGPSAPRLSLEATNRSSLWKHTLRNYFFFQSKLNLGPSQCPLKNVFKAC